MDNFLLARTGDLGPPTCPTRLPASMLASGPAHPAFRGRPCQGFGMASCVPEVTYTVPVKQDTGLPSARVTSTR